MSCFWVITGLSRTCRVHTGELDPAAELLCNFILFYYPKITSQSKQIGHHNHIGKKYCSHFDLWLRDEITELSVEVGIKTSFIPPHVLSTWIATSETFGIIPLATELAEKWKITILPSRRVTGIPHYRVCLFTL